LIHPHLLKIFDLGTEGSRKYICMELLEGQDLRRVLRTEPVDMPRATRFLVETASALGAMHAENIIHRDVKPSNIFVTTDDSIRLMDFGIAKSLEKRVTLAGYTAGTPAYMAPEQVTNFATLTPAADIYSLGVVAYEMYGGDTPYASRDFAELAELHETGTFEALWERRSTVPIAIGEFVHRMLDKAPAQRPAAREVETFFQNFALAVGWRS
jgi:serine/threonine protein kinase